MIMSQYTKCEVVWLGNENIVTLKLSSSVIAPSKALLSTKKIKVLISIIFFHKNICCGYSLEMPRRGASNEYHNICFLGEIRKIMT